ncbi:MAG: hypothetical protein ACOYMF_05415 [Bacteroidales bacterium]
MIELTEYAELVARMRKAQRNYFRTRSPQDLQDSKNLEKLVDQATLNIMIPSSKPTPTLF